MRPDFYTVLGVPPMASSEEIRQAFRARARQFHPDANPSDADAAEQFKIVNEAYRVLGTPQLRAAYDRALTLLHQEPAAAHPQGGLGERLSGVHHTARPTMPPRPTAHPSLALTITPGQASLVPMREVNRFYLLSELGATGGNAVIDPLGLDLALVIDRSHSMRAAKLYEAKQAVLAVLDQMQASDLLTLVFFSDRPEVLADGETIAARPGIEVALDSLLNRGSTRISLALDAALQRLAARQISARVVSLVLLTDGMTYGDDERCLELAADARRMGVSITTLGLGTGWNRQLLDRIAASSGGTAHFVEQPQHLRAVFENILARLRATLALSMQIIFEPAPGVSIARATRIAPDISDAFGPQILPEQAQGEPNPVAVELGAVVGRPESDNAAVLWEVLIDPEQLRPRDGSFLLGRCLARYWTPRLHGGQWESIEIDVHVPANLTGEHAPIEPDVRLALELMAAYRQQSQADDLLMAGNPNEAATRLHTAALRLRAAGDAALAQQAMDAAASMTGSLDKAVTAALRAKYEVRNLSVFNRLRRRGS